MESIFELDNSHFHAILNTLALVFMSVGTLSDCFDRYIRTLKLCEFRVATTTAPNAFALGRYSY